nr:DNA repair protein RecN [Desulfobulbaceae bacterium]
MLKELRIENLALIEKLRIDLGDRLSVLTGETGAGKSIILQAIDLLSGGRGATTWIRTGMDQAQIEALFTVSENRALRQQFEEMGLDYDDELLIKRTFRREGTSKYYINGGLATAKLVGQVTEKLISVGSQRDHQQLLSSRFHLDFIDLVGDLWKSREEVSGLFERWAAAKNQLAELKAREHEKEQRRDFLEYQVKEINEAAVVPGEDESLANDKKRLKSADDLRRMGAKSLKAVISAADLLMQVRSDLVSMAELDSGITDVADSITEQSYLVEEYGRSLRIYVDNLPYDDGNLEEIASRIHQLQQLKRKYGVTLDDVIAFGQSAADELAEIAGMDETVALLHKQVLLHEQELILKATQLSSERMKTAQNVSLAITRELKDLSFAQAEFEVIFQHTDTDQLERLGSTGWDSVQFMFSANPGEPVKPLIKIASGGELSRVMLALKCVLAKKDFIDTVIFDEVDAGMGGIAAEAVAKKIKELSGHHQVLCITHLPQIAACGQVHFKVAKSQADGRTNTTIFQLDHDERVAELARMLDGDSVSEMSLAFARELVFRNR